MTARPTGPTPWAPSLDGWPWRLALVFLTPFVAGMFTFYALASLSVASNDLSAGHVVGQRVEALLSRLKDAETGQRGYLLTADRAYLKPYTDAIAALPIETAAVSQSIGDGYPELLGVLAELRLLIDEKKAELARGIALAEQGQHSAALGIGRADLGKRTMDTIRALVMRVQKDIDADLSAVAVRTRRLQTSAALALALTLASTLYLIAMLRRTQRVATGACELLEAEAARRGAAEAGRERAHYFEFEARCDVVEAASRRRAAEESLAVAEINLSVTLASIGAGLIATDRAGRVTRVNGVAEQITGWSQAAALGRGLWEVFRREDQSVKPSLANPVEQMAGQGITVQDIQRVVAVSRSGERAELEVRTAVTRDEDGALLGAVMVFRDATRELRAQAESTRLAAIVASSSDAIIGKSLDGTITNWNRAAQNLFGYSAAEAIGQAIQILMPPDHEDEEMRILANLALGIPVPAFDTVRRAKGGALVHVSVAVSPIRDARGQIVGASKIARDITRRREAEAALHVSEARLRFVLEAAQIGTWDLDVSTGQAQCSLRHDRCFGYETAQVGWTFERFQQHVHPQDRVEVLQRFKAAVAERADWCLECRVIWPDASVHWIRLHGSQLEDGNGAAHMLGIVMDISEHMRAEEARSRVHELESENHQIQAATRLKSQFLANMSHELRTPLNAIIGFADLLHLGAVKADPVKTQLFVGHIRTSGRHLLQLINELLDLAKVEAGKLEFFPEPVDLAVLIREVVDILQALLLQKKIDLRVDIAPDLGELTVDAARLKQALYNYLSNAIKFSAPSGSIQVRALAEGATRFRVDVEDHGVGIAAADLPRLFTDFRQLDAGLSRLHQGTGLGLALTRHIVRAQGGEVGVCSTLGQGSTFYLVLDRVQAEDATITSAKPMGEAQRIGRVAGAMAPPEDAI